MKFRAVMQDPLYMREFQSIIATLSKLAKECVLILTDQGMQFIVNEEHSSTAAPLVWVTLGAGDYFPQYKMSPARPEHTAIVLALSAPHLNRALNVLRTGSITSCKFKLQRIQFPCMSIIASVVSPHSSETREVVHDVPVVIVPESDWSAYGVPVEPNSQLLLNVPSLRLMRSLIEKLKNISPNLVFHANSSGELNLVAESEMATITTTFRRLLARIVGGEPAQSQPNDDATSRAPPTKVEEASCSVDSRKASAFFTALQLPNEELIIGIDRENCIHIRLNVREQVVLHSILPAVCI